MHDDNENENIMQVMGNRNLDEMRQQTLDALKVVQSFEAKPARSARVQELLAQKAQSRQFVPGGARAKPAATLVPTAPQPAAQRPARHVLQPVKESASPEKRFASSPKKVPSTTASPACSPLPEKSSRVHEVSPAKGLFAKRLRPAPASAAADAQPPTGLRPTLRSSAAAPARPESQPSRASTQTQPAHPAAHAARRGPLVSSFRSVSRLLQPTAASAAKMRPVRAGMAPARTERLPRADESLRADTSAVAGLRPTTSAAARPASTRPSAVLAKPVASSGSAITKPTLPALGSKHPLRIGGLSQFNPDPNKPLALPASGAPSGGASGGAPGVPSGPSKVNRPVPAQHTSSGAPLPAPKSLLSSLLTKTHQGKQPAEPAKAVRPEAPLLSMSKPTVLQPVSLTPHATGPTQGPAVTSTPVRVTPNTSVGEHSSGSFHSFDFTNFSFEAEWARTPELRKKVLEQKNDDTLQLFGHMPPINLESIFGAEMQRQRR